MKFKNEKNTWNPPKNPFKNGAEPSYGKMYDIFCSSNITYVNFLKKLFEHYLVILSTYYFASLITIKMIK